MKIDVYEPIKVKWDHNTPDSYEPDDADLVVYMGSIEVYRLREVHLPNMWSDPDYENEMKDRAVGLFARKLLTAISQAGTLGLIA